MEKSPATTVLPKYIERGGEQALIPPGSLNSTQFYIFVLKADYARLQAMTDRLFNHPSGGAVEYCPLSDHVVVMFTHVDQLASPPSRQGWIAYHDIALWVPMIAVEKRMGVEMAERIVMYPPYIMVDNGTTMVTGREVYGLPKEMGTFTMPQDPNYASDFTADVMGYAPSSLSRQSVPSRLWTVQRQSSVLPVPHQPLKTLHDVFFNLTRVLNPFESKRLHQDLVPNIPSILKHLVMGIPALGLKQFRDAAQSDRACYQAIVEAPLQIRGFRGARLYADRFIFTLNDLASHPVAEDTGLLIGPQPAVMSVYLHLDMWMGPGITRWHTLG